MKHHSDFQYFIEGTNSVHQNVLPKATAKMITANAIFHNIF